MQTEQARDVALTTIANHAAEAASTVLTGGTAQTALDMPVLVRLMSDPGETEVLPGSGIIRGTLLHLEL